MAKTELSERRLLPRAGERAAPAPTHLTLETSAACNLRCTMCSLEEFYAPKGLMTLETFERCAPLIPALQSIDFGTTGENLLNPRLMTMMARARAISPGLHMHLQTNATLLDAALAETLVECGLDVLIVSIDAARPETFARIRLGARLDDVIQAVERVAAARERARARRPALHVTYTLQAANLGELPDAVDLAARLGASRLNVNNVEVYSPETLPEALYLFPHPDLPGVEAETRARARANAIDLHLPLFHEEEIEPCRFLAPGVSWDGEVTPCAALSYRRRYFHRGEWRTAPQRSFGNVHREALLDIWNSAPYVAFRAHFEAGRFAPECHGCARRDGVICG
ncbi:MAG: radical SAM protein [Planctomycetes bacterium]|nr:radical SAM protein [Planctomycetota bacterium]